MSIQLRHGLVAGLVLGCWLSAVAVAVSAELGGQASGQAPRTEPSFQPGDVLTVAPARANLLRGADVVAVVSGGQRLVVVEVRDQWIGTYVETNGAKKAGWLRATDFVPVAEAARPQEGQACLCAMQTTTAGAPTPVAAYPTGGRYTRDYYQDYKTSYYSHEPDPDIHAWQPWLHY
jgi:hypothetical protein